MQDQKIRHNCRTITSDGGGDHHHHARARSPGFNARCGSSLGSRLPSLGSTRGMLLPQPFRAHMGPNHAAAAHQLSRRPPPQIVDPGRHHLRLTSTARPCRAPQLQGHAWAEEIRRCLCHATRTLSDDTLGGGGRGSLGAGRAWMAGDGATVRVVNL
jgi:hypothetical protein